MEILDCIGVLKALGEENRLRLVRELLNGPLGVNQLADACEQTQYNVSKHLRTLREAGLVELEKQGQMRVYRLSPELRSQLKKHRTVIDLGCCTFDFGEPSVK